MFRYLLRYEVARVIFSGPGMALIAITGYAVMRALQHWQTWAAIACVVVLKGALHVPARRRFR